MGNPQPGRPSSLTQPFPNCAAAAAAAATGECARAFLLCAGLVAQDTQLFGANVQENIAYGLEPDEYTLADLQQAGHEKAVPARAPLLQPHTLTRSGGGGAAERSGAAEFINKFTHGFKTRIGEKGVRLSGGATEPPPSNTHTHTHTHTHKHTHTTHTASACSARGFWFAAGWCPR